MNNELIIYDENTVIEVLVFTIIQKYSADFDQAF